MISALIAIITIIAFFAACFAAGVFMGHVEDKIEKEERGRKEGRKRI